MHLGDEADPPVFETLHDPDLPEGLLADQVQAEEAGRGTEVEPAGLRAGADALHGLRLPPLILGERGDPLDPPVAGVDVVDEDADPAVLDIVPDARRSHVQQATLIARRR